MIAIGMLYSLVVSLVLGLAAWLLDDVAALRGWPRRWVWVGAASISVLVSLGMTLRGEHRPRRAGPATRLIAVTPGEPSAVASPNVGVASGATTRAARLGAMLDERAPLLRRLDTPLASAWAIGILVTALSYFAGWLRLKRRRRNWTPAELEGTDVAVSGPDGPAVVGLTDAKIVLPDWAFELDRETRMLMLGHEREHIRCRDPLLIHALRVAVALTPWNVVAWWMVRRLRLAIELDCDARVLRGVRQGVVARYGELLLTVASHRPAERFDVAPAFLEYPSSLRWRIIAMYRNTPPLARLRAACAGVGAAALLALAFILPAPRLAAQEPGDQSIARLYGSPSSSPLPVTSRAATRSLLERFAPRALKDGPRMIGLWRDATGRVTGMVEPGVVESIVSELRGRK